MAAHLFQLSVGVGSNSVSICDVCELPMHTALDWDTDNQICSGLIATSQHLLVAWQRSSACAFGVILFIVAYSAAECVCPWFVILVSMLRLHSFVNCWSLLHLRVINN